MKKAKLIEQKTKEEEKKVENKFSIKKLIISILVIVIVLVAFYFLTDFIVKKQKDSQDTESTETVDVRKTNDIDYSSVSKMVAKNYFLLFDKADDESNSQYDVLINSFKQGGFPYEFYYIDLSKDNHKELLADKSELKDLNNIKVKDTTLVVVSDGEISETYEGSEAILTYLISYFTTTDTSNSDSNSNSNSNSNSDSNANTESNSNK